MQTVLLFTVLIALLFTFNHAAAQEAAEQGEGGSVAEGGGLGLGEVRKLRLKDIRGRLAARGLECRGCAEKDDYAQLYFEQQHAPLQDPRDSDNESDNDRDSANAKINTGASAKAPPSAEEMDGIKARLREQGFGDGNFGSFGRMFSPSDLEGLSPEEMQRKLNVDPALRSKGRGSKKGMDEKLKAAEAAVETESDAAVGAGSEEDAGADKASKSKESDSGGGKKSKADKKGPKSSKGKGKAKDKRGSKDKKDAKDADKDKAADGGDKKANASKKKPSLFKSRSPGMPRERTKQEGGRAKGKGSGTKSARKRRSKGRGKGKGKGRGAAMRRRKERTGVRPDDMEADTIWEPEEEDAGYVEGEGDYGDYEPDDDEEEEDEEKEEGYFEGDFIEL